MNKTKILTLFALVIMLIGSFSVVPMLPIATTTTTSAQPPLTEAPKTHDAVGDLDIMPQAMRDALASALPDDIDPGVDLTDDVGLVLQDAPNNYKITYEPWKTKAAIHALAYDEASGFLALGGGYLYDNEIHIYRYNPTTGEFDKVWDSGDSIIMGDILSLAIGDTDLNDFMEIAAASSDGRVYVFEQRHIYDPFANTENMFDHVWTSPYTFRAFSVAIDDVDRDYRPDIVVGSWDGKVRCFEYSNHSGYPFSEEHWITYDEVWNSGDAIQGRIYTVATGDTNNNGLPEIIAGTREGRVYVFENDGITMWINGEPFPLINDNHYKIVWTSENYTWTPIMDMEAGELDGSAGEEIALVAQGQGVFVLDWDSVAQTYTYEKVYRPWDAWQSESPSPWRLDFWADSMVSANNVSYQFGNGTLIPEPISYTMVGGYAQPDAECYPFNTGLANETDGYYSIFDASDATVDNATAVIDFGKDEEGTGSASSAWDLDITLKDSVSSSVSTTFNISVSQSGTDWEQVNTTRYSYAGTHLYVDVDDALSTRKWDWFRYIKISVYNSGTYAIDSIKLAQVYTQITTALTVTIGPLPDTISLVGPVDGDNKLLVGTVIGTILAFSHGSSYDLVWDSSTDDNFSVGTNIWDMVHVGGDSRLPFWLQFWYSYLTPPGGSNYVHWSYGDIDPYDWMGGTNPYNILLVNDMNEITVYTDTGNPSNNTLALDSTLTGLFAPVTTDSGYSMVSVEMVTDPAEPSLPYAVVTYLSDDAAAGESYDSAGSMAGDMRFYQRLDSTSPYTTYKSISSMDYTGDIVAALTTAKAGPYIDFVDWDGDGDQDMILSTGFLYYCENLGIPSDKTRLQFKLHPGYFADVNAGEMSYFWGQPTAGDFDNDGDLDLVLGYDGKAGFTYWENTGSTANPTWIQNKRLFKNTNPNSSFRYQEFYDIRVAPLGHALPADTAQFYTNLVGWDTFNNNDDFTLIAYKPSTNQLFNFWPVYDQSEGYVLATYPEVQRYEFAPRETEVIHNFGFHVYKTWSTENDLNGWTLSVTSDDVDGDGKGELIVGDYDNNVYIFEHMVNNSYKRAFRSFDINYTEESTTSPYYWEELEGLSGSFKRVIWNHVDQLLAGVDIDRDGRNELVAAAGMQLYVFENTGIDDTYRLAYTIDFRNSQLNTTDAWNYVTGITALASGDDLDYNNMNELIVGLGPYLFVYNVPYNAWNSTEEYFMGDSLVGRHYLLGNGADDSFKHAKIQAIITGDTDEDGYRELIIGGVLNVTQSRSDGFLKVYEWTGLLFEEVWNAPAELTYWNPVTDIAIDDQDYDSHQELIIGHSKGFDVWEWNGSDSGYNKVEYVTSSPNYPYLSVKSSRLTAENHSIFASRGQNDIAYWVDDYDYIVGVFLNVSPNNHVRIYWRVYIPSVNLWYGSSQMFPVHYAAYPTYDVYNEMDPSLYYHPNGTLYITWRTRMWTGSADRYDLWWSKFNRGTNSWMEPEHIGDASIRRQPKAYLLEDGTFGIVYLATSLHRLFKATRTTSGWNIGTTVLTYQDYPAYYVTSFDMARLNDGGWAIAVSARNSSVSKTDLDIYVMTSDSSLNFADSRMYAATSSYSDEIFPDIGQLSDPEGNLMVVYEVPDADVADRVQMSYSLTGTFAMWRMGETMASIPEYIVRQDNVDGTVSYLCRNPDGSLVPTLIPNAYAPSILGLRNGGFMNSYVFHFSAYKDYDTIYHSGEILDPSNPYWGGGGSKLYHEYADFVYGINPSSRFTHYNIRSVVDLDVGESDGDNRREVVVGFDDRAAVYELASSNEDDGLMTHSEVWLSDPFDHDVTGVTAYDLNGNGYEEIGVATERGDVYTFEVDNSATSPLDLHLASLLWNNTGGSPIISGTNHRLLVYDIDGDGFDEIIRGEDNGTIRAFDQDGTELWSNNDFDGFVYDLALANTSTGLVIAASYEKFNYTLISATTGITLWNTTLQGFVLIFGTTTYYAGKVLIGDVAEAAGTEVVGASSLDEIRVWSQNGTMLWTHDLGVNLFAESIALGNFSGRGHLDIAVMHTNYTITILYGNNGSVYRHIEGFVAYSSVNPVVFDYNGDGYDDLAVATRRLTIIDGHSGDILYNSTVELPEDARQIWISNFDDDAQPEALLRTDHGVYYEEITSGRQVWSYTPSVHSIRTGFLGNFSGQLGLALSMENGCLVVLDALTGLIRYFEISVVDFNGAVAADFNGDGIDELVGTTADGQILAYSEVTPGTDEPVEQFTTWNQYWYQDLNQTVRRMYSHNLNTDPQDELIILDGNEIRAYRTDYPMTLWNYSVNGLIYDVAFGDLSGDGNDDILAYYLRMPENIFIVFALDGVTGAPITPINETYGAGTVNAIAIGDFDALNSGNEYVVVMKYGSNTGAAVYDSTGSKQYVTSTNFTSDAFAVKTGEFDGSAGLDFVIGTSTSIAFYSGNCTFLGNYNPGGVANKMATGEFNGDGYTDVLVSSADGSVRTINGQAHSSAFWFHSYGNSIDGIAAGNFDSGYPDGEVLLSLRGQGVLVVRGSAYSVISTLDIYSPQYIWLVTGDVDGNGKQDAVIVQGSHLAIYEIESWTNLAVYSSTYTIYEFIIGDFDGEGSLDMALNFDTRFQIVTNGTTPTLPLLSADLAPSDVAGFGFTTVAFVGGLPLLLGLVVVVKKRRRFVK